ncbi:MAG TPA: hypothetical protein IAB94_03120, partial [Candidatus Coproplasma avicola]|nr:hypothetical protein [Candidatus Coproplasma avicola]
QKPRFCANAKEHIIFARLSRNDSNVPLHHAPQSGVTTLPDLTANIFFSLSFRPSEQRERVEKSWGNAADKIAPRGLKNRAAQKNIIRKKKYLNVRVGNNTYPY